MVSQETWLNLTLNVTCRFYDYYTPHLVTCSDGSFKCSLFLYIPFQRLQKLESACPNPPCSLVLVSNQDGNKESVVGHCRIVPVKEADDTLYIEAGKDIEQLCDRPV